MQEKNTRAVNQHAAPQETHGNSKRGKPHTIVGIVKAREKPRTQMIAWTAKGHRRAFLLDARARYTWSSSRWSVCSWPRSGSRLESVRVFSALRAACGFAKAELGRPASEFHFIIASRRRKSYEPRLHAYCEPWWLFPAAEMYSHILQAFFTWLLDANPYARTPTGTCPSLSWSLQAIWQLSHGQAHKSCSS